MPELPEVETIVRGLEKRVLGWTFFDVWTDFKKIIKRPKSLKHFSRKIKGKKIEQVWRRGKNILFTLSGKKTLLVHQKMTGHLLLGKWQFENGKWSFPPGPLSDKINTFIHLLFAFKNGQMMALSDLRKFAKVELWETKELERSKDMRNLGPEPLDTGFTFENFKTILNKKKGRIKQVLMDQTVIVGIGNIYSDEILWQAKIHPFRDVQSLDKKELKNIYQAMKEILQMAVEFKGTSISDFRTISGERGYYGSKRKVYRREGEKCPRCSGIINRIKIGGRSTCYCPNCQK